MTESEDQERLVRLDTFSLRHRSGTPFKNDYSEGDEVETPLGPGVIESMAWVDQEGVTPRLDVYVRLDRPTPPSPGKF